MPTTWQADTDAIRVAAIARGIGSERQPPSARAIALATGVPPSTMARIWNGAPVGPGMLATLPVALGQPVERLFRAVVPT